ncbi:4'-phosphopantetheinyl transferase superfamily protein [Geminocystis sp. GBBB08]|uniref:4'-phosphopantetheinyl transferase family protein n=1 Tax=Geminocystis sp. GBBB08 TaxID=2604140 RepID=UPI0027E29BD1|nr:4'-phosphopantetheinyl transferase superfamily protein [Geminocystis sp. GBBB08]MBL1209923.1 4'-phosphopantetheinyl transferase superfamily protein [Geminocystis sp. GBBB08]
MWQYPPQNLSLSNNDIHIWMIEIESYRHNIYNFQEILSPDEQERINRFSSKSLKEYFIIYRGYLRIILSQYLTIKPDEICFTYSSKGKPLLDQKILSNIKFNLSHKNNYAVYAISKYNVGIDLEKIDEKVRVENIAKRYFCHDEFDYLINLESSKKAEYFFKLWTIKEAYLKAIGEGLSGGLDSICFGLNKDNQPIKLVKENHRQKKDDNWHFQTWNLLDNYIMSVAIDSPIKLKFYYYSDLSII